MIDRVRQLWRLGLIEQAHVWTFGVGWHRGWQLTGRGWAVLSAAAETPPAPSPRRPTRAELRAELLDRAPHI